MTAYAAHVAKANAEIFGRLGGDVTLVRPSTGETFVGLKGQIRQPRAGEVLRDMGVVRDRPELRLPAGPVTPQKGDEVWAQEPVLDLPWRWRIAAPPERPGQGYVWSAELEDLGQRVDP